MIETDRLILRAWHDDDLEAIAAINADPRVMAYFPNLKTRKETAYSMARWNQSMDEHGFGFGACESKESRDLVGIVGLAWLNFEAVFAPAVEIGWRLSPLHWGKGFASEAATGWMNYGFEQKKLNRIVSITVKDNTRSIAVMERIGMKHVEGGDFAHPLLPKESPLSVHVLYEARA